MANWIRHLRRRRLVKARQLPSVIAIGAIVAWSALSVVNAFGSSKGPGIGFGPQYEYSTTITTSTSTSTSTTTTTTPTNTKPGKGCGDKNHLHERRFECKVVISGTSAKEG